MRPQRLTVGGLIDRTQTLPFTFDGRTYHGHPGDTLASALLANGVRLVGRSFKYHRPRGILTAGPEEPNALVELRDGARREPNTKATEIELYNGLVSRSQNRWPSLAFDLRAIHGWAGPLIAAGFYYKTFMWPKKFWESVYEPLIRRAAGLGRAAHAPDPDHYEALHSHCDVLVVGAGAAGLAAALAAAQSGARVIVCEQDFVPGGGLLSAINPVWQGWRDETLAALHTFPEVELLTRTNVFGYYDHNLLGALERVNDHVHESQLTDVRQRYRTIRARQVVLATGASERLIACPGNDKPGVMLAGAAQTYVRRFGVAPGQRAVVFTNNDSAYDTAHALIEAGLSQVVVADVRPHSQRAAALQALGAEVRFDVEVTGFNGRMVTLCRRTAAQGERIAADLLCLSGGWNPNVHLASQSGAAIRWEAQLASYVPGDAVQAERSAGAVRGVFGFAAALQDGWQAGRAAAVAAGFAAASAMPASWSLADDEGQVVTPLLPVWEVKPKGRRAGKSFVDLQHDVTADDIRLAHREGYQHIEHAKRYTTHNMATDQGKTGGLVGAAVLAQARGEPVDAVGLPTYRPYTQPVSFGAIAAHATGDTVLPIRRTALHAWHKAHGAIMQPAGDWLRPFYYPQPGETPWQAILREARAVRAGVGLCDVSTLGKIDIQDRDAAILLDRIYANTFSTLAPGRCRYGLMLREDGIVFDDGTTARLADDHYLMTTTTGQAAAVLEHLEYHTQVVWPDLDVQLACVTDQWAQMALAGPGSRDVLRSVLTGLDLDNAAFPFMAAGAGMIANMPVRVFRISFSGELAYEIAAPSGYGERVWTTLLAAGESQAITPYGVEALNLLRIEKGHAAGAELNGWTTAADLGLARMLKKDGDYIGRVLQKRPALSDPARPRLVGIKPVDASLSLRSGAHIVPSPEGSSIGWVSSVTQSIEKQCWIGLALVENGAQLHGQHAYATSPLHKECVEVVIVPPIHVDPEGSRVRA